VRDLLQDEWSPGDGEGDFDRLDAASQQGFGHIGQQLARGRAHDRDNAGGKNSVEEVGGEHWLAKGRN
jgi:hypothetical protein